MAIKRDIPSILGGFSSTFVDVYDTDNLSLGFIGSHSACDGCKGAQLEDIPNFVVAKKGRELTYTKAFHEREQGGRKVGAIQEVRVVDNWNDMTSDEVVFWMRERNGVFVPSRSLAVYLRDKSTGSYDPILGMTVPFFGNIDLLQAEERADPYKIEHNQDFLAEEANLPVPKTFKNPDEIDGPALIKASQFSKDRDFERNFIVVNSPEEYYKELDKVVSKAPDADKDRVRKAFKSATIQEYLGKESLINLNFFYSPTWDSLELLGTDSRTQFPNGEECTHIPISLRESLYEQSYQMGVDLVEAVGKHYPQGLVGPFAIQCLPDENEKLRPIDLSLRIPGSPDSGITPSAFTLYGERMDFGRRIAIELKDAVREGTLDKILS